MTNMMIRAEGLVKSFKDVKAVKGVDLEVAEGTVFGLLGPNGAGKTTTVRILTTLLEPDAGHATVAGYDVVGQADRLRFEIGLAGQFAAVDENLTGIENLEMVGRLYHLSKKEARTRAIEVLERFGLAEAGSRVARNYSGGMRRRLDLGASLVGRPKVLFLDEPTTGLDPRSRIGLWELIRELVRDGTTLMLTTQYLEEADILADRVAVIDLGTVIAEGTSDELKNLIGGEVLEMRFADPDIAQTAMGMLGSIAGEPRIDADPRLVRIPVGNDGSRALTETIRKLDEGNIKIDGISLHRPTLDDVFLKLTGHGAEEEMEVTEGASR